MNRSKTINDKNTLPTKFHSQLLLIFAIRIKPKQSIDNDHIVIAKFLTKSVIFLSITFHLKISSQIILYEPHSRWQLRKTAVTVLRLGSLSFLSGLNPLFFTI